MPPPRPRPRNACYKDSIVAYLALKAHFAVADNHPKDSNVRELGKLMLMHDTRDDSWHGEYYSACKLFAMENLAEMQHNSLDIDNLLKAQNSSYWNGEKLWRKAGEVKRELLNDYHTVLCQEVNPACPQLPSGKLLSDLMEVLRKNIL
jgi:hypothetical protein